MEPKQVVDALASRRTGDIAAAFDESFSRQVSSSDVAEVWTDALRQFGDFEVADEPVVLYDFPLRFAHGVAHLQVAYRDGDIAGLVLKPGAPTLKFGD